MLGFVLTADESVRVTTLDFSPFMEPVFLVSILNLACS